MLYVRAQRWCQGDSRIKGYERYDTRFASISTSIGSCILTNTVHLSGCQTRVEMLPGVVPVSRWWIGESKLSGSVRRAQMQRKSRGRACSAPTSIMALTGNDMRHAPSAPEKGFSFPIKSMVSTSALTSTSYPIMRDSRQQCVPSFVW